MQPQNGADYAHNYDIIVKWLSPALRGQTLDVIGVESGTIEDVFGFEPAEITVKAGRVDVMLRDHHGKLFHLEEERNLKSADMYRFAGYHFLGAGQFGRQMTDVILASGDPYTGETVIETGSGRYAPVIIDFTDRKGRERLAEIRDAVEKGTFDKWLELVFLPLYGKEKGEERSVFVEEVIRFQTRLVKAEKISSKLVAATLIMSNKLIGKDRINELWEEIKMLDVLEVARKKGVEIGFKEGKDVGLKEGEKKGKIIGLKEGEKKGKIIGLKEGEKKGKIIGIEEGRLKKAHRMLLAALTERFGVIPSRISDRIEAIEREKEVDALFLQVFRCHNIEAFEEMLGRLDL